jgi:hypothetical protein
VDERGQQDAAITASERGRLAGVVGEFLEEQFNTQSRQIDARIFAHYKLHGAIPADMAIQAWIEKFTLGKTRAMLRQEQVAGVSAGRRLEPLMNRTFAATTPSTENGGYEDGR